MGRPKKISDEEFIEGARACLIEHGPTVSTSTIAKCLGVSQATVFKRFSTKEEMVIACLRPPSEVPLYDVLRNGPDDRDFLGQFKEVIRLLNGHLEKNLPAINVLRAAGISPEKLLNHEQDQGPFKVVGLMTEWFKRAKKKGQIRDADPQALAIALIGAIHSRLMLQHVSQNKAFYINSTVYVNAIVDALWNGIAPGGEDDETAG